MYIYIYTNIFTNPTGAVPAPLKKLKIIFVLLRPWTNNRFLCDLFGLVDLDTENAGRA